jgi:hypothetical protein
LRLDPDSTENGNDTELGVFAVLAKAFLHLGGELARRSEDENTDAVGGLAFRVSDRSADQVVNYGKGEARGLSRACLRQANQVSSRKRQGNRLLLNRGRVRIAGIAHGLQQFGREVELGKGEPRVDFLFTHLP